MFDFVDNLIKLFSHVCHQIPDRSFGYLVYSGKSILCARCTGMYLGLLFGATLAVFAQRIRNMLIVKMLLISIFILIMEMIVENIVELAFGNVARFITGIIFGVSVGIGIMAPVKQTLRRGR